MTSKAKTISQYIKEVTPEKRVGIEELHHTILKYLPSGFEATMSYGMIGYVVPHKLYPDGYHCDPKLPLPFISIAAQKKFYAFYHMGIYADPEMLGWFKAEWPKHTKAKLDMGKSCIRFKKAEDIPLKLIGQLVKKISVKGWIATYEKAFIKARKK